MGLFNDEILSIVLSSEWYCLIDSQLNYQMLSSWNRSVEALLVLPVCEYSTVVSRPDLFSPLQNYDSLTSKIRTV